MQKEFFDRIEQAIGDRRDAVQNAETARDQLADAEQQFVLGVLCGVRSNEALGPPLSIHRRRN